MTKTVMVADRHEAQFRRLAELEGRSQELQMALEADAQRINALEQLKSEYEARLAEAGIEIQAEREKAEAERRKVAELEASLQRVSWDVEAQKKRTDDAEVRANTAEANARSGVAAASKEGSKAGFARAATHYKKQLFEIREKVWAMGWRAAQKEAGITEGHPSFKEPPKFPVVPASTSAPSSAVPPEGPSRSPDKAASTTSAIAETGL